MIEVKNLQFTYPGTGEKTIKGIDFSISKGEIFGFLGPSGAGKSTTQKILTGLLKRYQGHASVMGKDIKDWNRDFYEKVGVGFELPNLYQKLTALENLQLVAAFYSGPTEDPLGLLKTVGLAGQANLKVARYSKGMKMRLNFVRAFLNKPELVFLDEPTSGMDPVNAKNIKDIILAKKQEGMTIFLTTHNMTVADELCDRVAFIIDGRLELVDSPQELKIRYGQRNLKVVYFQGQEPQEQEFSLDHIGHNEEFLQILKEKRVKTIHTQEATLEDIFIKATGRSLT
ncbi:MAG: ATP-binding cassette domain-containing protein [Peptococcaceae bacterium]